MNHFFKNMSNMIRNKDTRWISLIIIFIMIYLPVGIIGGVAEVFFSIHWLDKPLDIFYVCSNATMTLLISGQWSYYIKDNKRREKENLDRVSKLSLKDQEERDKMLRGLIPGIVMYPFNYKKARRNISLLYMFAVACNIISSIFIIWA